MGCMKKKPGEIMQDEMQPVKQTWTNGNSCSYNKLPLSAHAVILTNPVTHSLTAQRRWGNNESTVLHPFPHHV